MSAREQQRDSKLLGLELIRFTCSFAVLLWHYRHFYALPGAPEFVHRDQPLYAVLTPLYDFGIYGVQLFWGISGFIFFWKYGAAIAEGAVRAGRFAWLRFTRLYPLHVATLLIVAALQPVHQALTGSAFIYHDDSAAQFLLHLGLATQWGPAMPFSFNGPVWSVSAEVLVYALFFALASVCRDRFRLCLIMLIAGMVAMMAGVTSSPVLFCATYFFAGGLAAELWARSTNRQTSVMIAAIVLASLAVAAWVHEPMSSVASRPLLLLVGLIPLLVLAAADWPALDRWARPIQAVGNLTYSTYLCHFPLQLALAVIVAAAGLTVPVASPLFLLAYLATTLAVGHLVFTRFERPVQGWLRNWSRRRAVAVA